MRRWLLPWVLVATVLMAPSLAGPVSAQPIAADFYLPPSPLPAGVHGKLIRSEPSVVLAAPLATSRRIMYLSQDRRGRSIAVTGTVIVPLLPWFGTGARPLVAYAVGTQGLGDRCAPSKLLTTGLEYEEVTIGGLVARGYSVVVPDYEGLGTPGTHTYLNQSLGHALLDAVRAAKNVPGVGSGPVGLMGYSEGGVATAAAAELKATYAPELNIKGAAVGASGNSLSALVDHVDGTVFAGFIGYVLAGLQAAYPDEIDLGKHLNAAGMQVVAAVRDQCVWETLPPYLLMRSSTLTRSGRSVGALLSETPLASVIGKQLPGLGRPSVPVYVAHSRLDDVAPYGPGREVARQWCARGGNVRFLTLLSPGHIGANPEFGLGATLWLEGLFAGRRAVSNCGSF